MLTSGSGKDIEFNLQDHVNNWFIQLKSEPSITESDSEELKSHLLDMIDDLRNAGLDDVEAFWVASKRMGSSLEWRADYEEVNKPIIQMRKVIWILSGIFGFFLFFFLMRSVVTLLALSFYEFKVDEFQSIRYILQFLIVFHLFFVMLTILAYFRGKKLIEKMVTLTVSPKLAILTFTGVIALILIDLWFLDYMRIIFDFGSYMRGRLVTIYDYSNYSFPLTIAICILILLKKISNYSLYGVQGPENKYQNECDVFDTATVENQWKEYLLKLKQIGLDEDEVQLLIARRKELSSGVQETITSNSMRNLMRTLQMILSGVLVYFFFYYLLFSTGKMLFTFLQFVIENNPVKNIKRTWSYAILFQLATIFATISLYLQDYNIVQRIKKINIKSLHTRWLFWATIVFAIIDRCFYPIVRNSVCAYNEPNAIFRTKIMLLFYYTSYSLPIVICSCFLFAFYMYYRDHVKIG